MKPAFDFATPANGAGANRWNHHGAHTRVRITMLAAHSATRRGDLMHVSYTAYYEAVRTTGQRFSTRMLVAAVVTAAGCSSRSRGIEPEPASIAQLRSAAN